MNSFLTRRGQIKEKSGIKSSALPTPVATTTTTIVREKRKLSVREIVASIILVLVILCCCLFTGLIITSLAWMQTWRAFTQETVAAEITVSELRKDTDGKPYYVIKYTPKNDVSALSFVLGDIKSQDKEVTEEIPGDQFVIETNHFKWSDWITFLGVKPMYKTFRITGLYKSTSMYSDSSYPKKAAELNGGQDKTWQHFQENSKQYNFVGTAYLSNPGQYITDHPRTFNLIATEDGMILKEK